VRRATASLKNFPGAKSDPTPLAARPIRAVFPSSVSLPQSEDARLPALSLPAVSMSNPSKWFADEVQPHESSLRSYLRNVFPSLPDVDDLVQESYARLIRAREAGRVSYVKAFLFTTARNALANRAGAQRRRLHRDERVADRHLDVEQERPRDADVRDPELFSERPALLPIPYSLFLSPLPSPTPPTTRSTRAFRANGGPLPAIRISAR
jgi:hypothetical protein